jgi:hypothetical protein
VIELDMFTRRVGKIVSLEVNRLECSPVQWSSTEEELPAQVIGFRCL